MENKTSEVEKKPQSFKQSFWELVRFMLIALVIVVPLRMFVVEPFAVSGSSMVPTFQNGNYLIVDKISYKLSDPKRYDVIVFKYPNDHTKFFIKRIIGLPDETVDVKDNIVTVTNTEHPNGFVIEQPYVQNLGGIDKHLVLGKDEYFVMGDNRGASSDSRYWGAVKRNLITGRALLRLLPINEISIWPGNYQPKNN